MTSLDIAHDAARKAVTAWIAKGDGKAGQELRDALAALAAAGSTRPESLKPGVMKSTRAKRRKAT